jgi:uncharacterized protein Usg
MSLALQLDGHRLSTADILYHRPDHPGLLQTFIWQQLDMEPRFPELTKFLEFWGKNLDGQLHSVTVASNALIRPVEFRWVECELKLH